MDSESEIERKHTETSNDEVISVQVTNYLIVLSDRGWAGGEGAQKAWLQG